MASGLSSELVAETGLAQREAGNIRAAEEAAQAEIVSRMNVVANAIAGFHSTPSLGDFQFAMHGEAKMNADGEPLTYEEESILFSAGKIATVFTGYHLGDNFVSGPHEYWAYDASRYRLRTNEKRDDNDWSALRYVIDKENGTYIGKLIVPAFVVKRNHVLDDIGTLGDVEVKNFVLRTVRRSAKGRNASVTESARVAWGKDIADFRKNHHPRRYAEALLQIADAEDTFYSHPDFVR